MRARYLHYITQEHLEIWQTDQRAPRYLTVFQATASGTKDFEDWLATHQQGVHSVLADLPDEIFHQESIPPLGRRDRRILIARKLAHQFHGSTYTTHISLGRETSGRRDERVLLTGFSRPATLDMWLAPLMRQEIAVAAIHTPALLSHLLLEKLRPKAKRGLLISCSDAGQRHVYFDNQTLRFARLSSAVGSGSPTDAPIHFREIQKTLQYLVTQRWIERNERMPVWLPANESDAQGHQPASTLEPQFTLHHISLEPLASTHELQTDLVQPNNKTLLIQLASNGGQTPQLAQAGVRQFFEADRGIQRLVACALLGFVALLAASFSIYQEIMQVRHDLLLSEAARSRDEAALSALHGSLPELPASIEALRQIANIPVQHDARRHLSSSALSSLSQSLGRFPEVELDTLAWRLPALSFNETAPKLSLNVQARMNAPANTPAEQIQPQIQAFIEDLLARDFQIQELDTPFNTGPDKHLQSQQEVREGTTIFRLSLNLERATQ